MFLKSLKLVNFRNYSILDFDFKSQITILIGDNAQGKSNFLESIYFLATNKSPKAFRDEELISQDESFSRVEGEVIHEEEKINLEIAMQLQDIRLVKRVKVNGISKRIMDYTNNLLVVLFSPEDINLVTGSPSLRRNHLDLTLSQIDKNYKKSLSAYLEIITKKNRILKNINEGKSKIEELDFWSSEQLQSGKVINEKRKEFFTFINSTERKFGDFTYQYNESPLTPQRLKEYLGREIASSTSLIGPHRDDFQIIYKQKDLARFGSRGEHRTAILDLKVTESLFFESKTSSKPLLLLDDIFSELDLSHREHVLNLTKLNQTIIASVQLEDDVKLKLKDALVFRVEKGEVNPFD